MRASKNDLPKSMETKEMVMQEAEWGDMHVEYDTFHKEFDVTPFLKGLPGNRDPCPHWGVVVKGKMRIKYDGHEEIVKAGDAYYMPAGHTAVAEAGTEVWEFSPKDELKKTMEVVMRNFEAMQK